MVITLYFMHASSPSLMTLTTLNALNLEHEQKIIDLSKGEHKTPEFLAMNPRGKIPALADGAYTIAESRAIATYLCNQYEKGEDSTRLYPTDPQARGLVDQMLYVSENTNDIVLSYVNISGVLLRGEKPNEDKIPEVRKALERCEGYLSKREYVAGDHVTLADFFMASPFTMLVLTKYDDFKDFPKTIAWLGKLKALPYFDKSTKEGMEMLKMMYSSSLAKSSA